MEIKYAKITKTRLGRFENGFLGAQICFDYNGGGQCVAFEAFYNEDEEYIPEILEALEVSFWKELLGIFCRVKVSREGISAIGHFTKSNWVKLL